MKWSIVFFIFICSPSAFPAQWYYPESYAESRLHFKESSADFLEKYRGAEALSHPVSSQTEASLSIDGLYIPQQGDDKKKLLIITSGVHGVEAFTGSAIQDFFLHSVYTQKISQKMGILLIHGINPYGFNYKRRVTENNVDLNRNLSGNRELFQTRNKDYDSFSDFLNPEQPLSAHWYNDIVLFAQSIKRLVLFGKQAMTQIVVGGQYQDNKGVYFGGNALEENSEIIAKVFKKYGYGYQKILHLDLHTGYGERGRLHFFSSQEAAQQPGFNTLFKGYRIDLASDEDFYKTSGSFENLSMKIFSDQQTIPMTLEFGTMNSQTILGGFYSLKNMIYENQGTHYGYQDTFSKNKVELDFIEMFNPSDVAWRSQVLKITSEVLPTLTERFSKM